MSTVQTRIQGFIDGNGVQAEDTKDQEDITADKQPSGNRKRKHETDAPTAAKASRTEGSGDLEIDLTGSRKITVNKFKGKLYVSVSGLYMHCEICYTSADTCPSPLITLLACCACLEHMLFPAQSGQRPVIKPQAEAHP